MALLAFLYNFIIILLDDLKPSPPSSVNIFCRLYLRSSETWHKYSLCELDSVTVRSCLTLVIIATLFIGWIIQNLLEVLIGQIYTKQILFFTFLLIFTMIKKLNVDV